MARRYHLLDVFTDKALAGNPLAVVVDGEGLDDAAMAKVAREFNLSETVFVGPPRDPTNFAAIRIFTPATELPFAGHPTIGTAVLLAELRARDLLVREEVGLVLEEAIGLVSCTVRHRRGEAAHARFEVPKLSAAAGDPENTARLADLLGLESTDIGFDAHGPARLSAGVPFTFVPIVSIDALSRAVLARQRLEAGQHAFYLYTPVTDARPRTFRARMLAAGLGVDEDPATGSAAAAFPGALLANEQLADREYDCVLHQGVEMGRPSRIGLAFSVEGGRLTSTVIGGEAVIVADGALEL